MKFIKVPLVALKVCCLLICFGSTISKAQEYNPPASAHPAAPLAYSNTPVDNTPAYNKSAGYPVAGGFITLNGGLANPEGRFGSSAGSGYGGYAMPGYIFNLSIGIPISHSNFGIAFMFGNYSNPYNLTAYTGNNSEYVIYPDQDYYPESSIMTGLYATYPIGPVSFDGRVMMGSLISSLPEQDYGYSDARGDSYQCDMQPSNATSPAFDLGAGVRCRIGHFRERKLCVMLNVDYLYSNVSYHTEKSMCEMPGTGSNAGYYQVQTDPSPVYSGSLSVELLNVTFGIGYQL